MLAMTEVSEASYVTGLGIRSAPKGLPASFPKPPRYRQTPSAKQLLIDLVKPPLASTIFSPGFPAAEDNVSGTSCADHVSGVKSPQGFSPAFSLSKHAQHCFVTRITGNNTLMIPILLTEFFSCDTPVVRTPSCSHGGKVDQFPPRGDLIYI